jgi:AraC-like DNA-binding protein
MRININSQVFREEELKKILSKDSNNQYLIECDWLLKNEYAYGVVKEVRLRGVFFLAYNLNTYKKDEMFVSHDLQLFKLHFEFEGDIKYQFKRSVKKSVDIKKGRFELLYITEENYKITSNRTARNSVELFFDETYLRSVIGNEFRLLLSNLSDKNKEGRLINYGVSITEEINIIITSIKNCEYVGTKRNVFLDIKIKELIIVAIAIYGGSYNEKEELICVEQSLQGVVNYIKLNLKKELNISELSILAGMNTSKFKKCFKQLYGVTVFKYITSLRIERAKALIQQKSYTISQASYEVGYKNAQHFTVAFKKKMGFLPSKLKGKG